MEAAMKDLSSSRWLCISLPAIASTLGLMLLAATVLDVLADHAIGTEAQIAWQARLLEVDEALARSDLAAAERQWREAYAGGLPRGLRREGPPSLSHGLIPRARRGLARGRAARRRALRRARRPRGRRTVHSRRAPGRGSIPRSAGQGVRPCLHGALGGGRPGIRSP